MDLSFENIFKVYYTKLTYIAYGYVGNKEDSEGIAQNVLLKLWDRRDGLSEIKNLNNFLFTLTKNESLDVIRQRKIVGSYTQFKQSLEIEFIENEGSSAILEAELAAKVHEAVDSLPEKCKNVVVMSFFDGKKRHEIAEELNLSPRTVDNHLANAKKYLKVYLKNAFFMIFM